jgi:hypothetical protein
VKIMIRISTRILNSLSSMKNMRTRMRSIIKQKVKRLLV